jgi:DNA-binding PadR family transcriptional regulator
VAGRNGRRLTTTSYMLLAQLSLRPWSTYDLIQQRVRYFRYVWPRAESAIYREVKQLAGDGLVDGHRERTGRRGRTVYSINEKGLETLRAWLDTPVSPFAMEFEAMIRLLVAPLASTEQIVGALEQVRADAQDMLSFASEVKQEFLDGRGALQDQAYVRALAVDFFVGLLNTVDSWAARTLDEVNSWDGLSLEDKNMRGLEIFGDLPVTLPDRPGAGTPVAPETQARRRRSDGAGS